MRTCDQSITLRLVFEEEEEKVVLSFSFPTIWPRSQTLPLKRAYTRRARAFAFELSGNTVQSPHTQSTQDSLGIPIGRLSGDVFARLGFRVGFVLTVVLLVRRIEGILRLFVQTVRQSGRRRLLFWIKERTRHET